MTRIQILGAGMAGLGAAHRLRGEGISAVVYDKASYPGGHAASFVDESGFVFDDGPHISFTKDERIQELFAENVNGEYEAFHSNVNNYWHGHWIKHPAQCNLHGLPVDLVVKVLRDFVAAQQADTPEIRNYEDWLVASFGTTFADNFPMVYTRKYHTTDARNMSTDWLGPRLYRPQLEEVLRGALSPSTPDVHYVSNFRYPTNGGFAAYLDRFVQDSDVRLNHRVTRIDPMARRVHFGADRSIEYDHLVSSIPLPALVPMIDGVPQDVVDAAGRLAATQCVIVNVGVDREDISEAHWSYFYDPDLTFTRLSFPGLFSPNNVPPGAGSVQAEVYYSPKYRPLDRSPEEFVEPVIADLRRCGLLREDDEILFTSSWTIPYANVIFDLERAPSLETVHGYLDDIGIAYCGRFGEWGYHWTDDSFRSGEAAAEKVLEAMTTGRGVGG